MSIKFLLLGLIVPFLVSFIAVNWLHPILVKLALDKNLVDNPDARKLQKLPVPVLGGIAVFWGIAIGLSLASLLFNSYIFFPIFVAITIMMYVGLLDDIRGLSAVERLVIEIAVLLFILFMTEKGISSFHGALGLYDFPRWGTILLSVFAGAGIINSINMIDGVDGLSSGFCLLSCSVFGYAFLSSGSSTMAILSVLCVASILPFFLHNIFGKTSKMFIGDSGTLMMGVLITIFVFYILSSSSKVAFNYPNMGVIAFTLSVLSVPIFDTLRVMTGRIMKGVSPFHADRSHLHHLFIEIGFSHVGTTFCVLLLNSLNILCWLISYQLGANPTLQLMVVVVIGILNTTGFYLIVRRLNKQHLLYRFLRKLAGLSHIELGSNFHKIRHFIDKY